jgi:hypothetical protein
VITGCESVDRVDQAMEAARTFKKMGEAQVAALVAKVREDALSGNYEKFKTSSQFDGTAKNPQWMA